MHCHGIYLLIMHMGGTQKKQIDVPRIRNSRQYHYIMQNKLRIKSIQNHYVPGHYHNKSQRFYCLYYYYVLIFFVLLITSKFQLITSKFQLETTRDQKSTDPD